MDNLNADFIIETNNLEAEYSLNPSESFDCSFELFASGVTWGNIEGDISNQTDLINLFNEKVDVSQYEHDIDEINEKIDGTLNNIVGSELIDVEREDQTVTISSKTFVFEQAIAANEWDIVHNLNKRPSIQLVDSSGKEFEAVKEYISNNQVIIRLDSATSGLAYLN